MAEKRKFIPSSWDDLEVRLVATHGVVAPAAHIHVVVRHPVVRAPKPVVPQVKATTLGPAAEINKEFASFVSDFTANLNTTFQTPTSSSGFSGYIEARVGLLSQRLINYFNTLPVKLPTNQPGTISPYGPRAAIQTFIQEELVTGVPAMSNEPLSGTPPLTQSLINIPFPTIVTTASSSLYYNSAINVIETARLATLAGVQGLFNHGSPQIFTTTSTTGTTTGGA